MMDWDAIDYISYLNQDVTWPSHRDKKLVYIIAMHPSHAIGAYHVLVDWGVDHHVNTVRSRLAMALLDQAIGESVVYEQDVPGVPDVQQARVSPSITLADCFDILECMADFDTEEPRDREHHHPIARAQHLQDLFSVFDTGGDIFSLQSKKEEGQDG
jgi:hypothetical protein